MSYTSTRTILLCSIFLLAACAPTEDDSARGPSGSVGKADHVSGTCVGACGGKSEGTCWCDDLCSDYGDCCDDAGEVCSVDECNADGTGCHDGDVCVAGEPNLCTEPAPVDCPDAGAPGVDYKSEDPAVCAAIRFTCPDGWEAFTDECGCGCIQVLESCGGILAPHCGEGEFCDYGAHCGAGDQSGFCKPMPEVCTAEYVGVCGCDGVTYATVCTAHQHGVSVADLTACAPAPDSCEDHCGGQSEDGSCWCDSLCSYYGDCCDDKASFCS